MGMVPETFGRIVYNYATSVLVNNTALTRTVSVPANARWLVHGGKVFNADDVARNVIVVYRDSSNNEIYNAFADAMAASLRSGFPRRDDAGVSNRESNDGVSPIPLSQGSDIIITWAAGGASAGGTADSSIIVEEWIED